MLLDAGFLIDLMAGRPEAVALAKRLDEAGETLRLPSPALFELWVGSQRVVRKRDERLRLGELLISYEAVDFEANDARAAGKLQSTLIRSGTRLGTVDAQLAGMALARSEPLVTGDRALIELGCGLPVRGYARD